KIQLHQSKTLNTFELDVLYPAYKNQYFLKFIGHKTIHIGRRKTAIRHSDINCRRFYLRENIHIDFPDYQKGKITQRQHCHNYGYGLTKGKSYNIHCVYSKILKK